jgi:hypothetical protein
LDRSGIEGLLAVRKLCYTVRCNIFGLEGILILSMIQVVQSAVYLTYVTLIHDPNGSLLIVPAVHDGSGPWDTRTQPRHPTRSSTKNKI